MKYIGKFGEHRVLAALLEQEIEAYLAIKSNQQDYDITAIPRPDRVVRIQVKTTELYNRSTNNAIAGTDKTFDFLVIVVLIDETDVHKGHTARFFVISHEEATRLRGSSKLLGVSYQSGGLYIVKQDLLEHEDKWEKIFHG